MIHERVRLASSDLGLRELDGLHERPIGLELALQRPGEQEEAAGARYTGGPLMVLPRRAACCVKWNVAIEIYINTSELTKSIRMV